MPRPPLPKVSYDWDVPYSPCYWDKKASKDSASISCALSGASVLTGKYGVIQVNEIGEAVEAVPDPSGRPGLVAAPFSGMAYMGDEPDPTL